MCVALATSEAVIAAGSVSHGLAAILLGGDSVRIIGLHYDFAFVRQ